MTAGDYAELGGRMIGIGVVGLIIAIFAAYAEGPRVTTCPRCRQPRNYNKRRPKTEVQTLEGGWTCPECRCDVDRYGKERRAGY